MSHWIGGKWIQGGQSFDSINPATNKLLWSGGHADQSLVDQAVQAADLAFDGWASLSHEERVSYLLKYAEHLKGKKEEIATAISQEMGKPHWEAKGEVGAMVGKVQLSIDAFDVRCKQLYQELPHAISVTRHKPHGVVAVFGPFNFPGHLPNGHIVPALLAGNTIVLKPSELTPLTGEMMVRYWDEIGLPKGVLNMVQGGAETGKALSSHPQINGLFFTGSCTTGQILAEQFAKTPEKILALEMGGNNPLVVWETEQKKTAAYHAVQSAFITAGQRCTCARRVICEVNDPFIEEFVALTESIEMGAPDHDPEPFMGPLVHESHAEQVMERCQQLLSMGAKWLVKAKRDGAFVSPGILDVTGIQGLPDEEIFGPITQLSRTDSLNSAIATANRTRFGLAAGLLSDSSEVYTTFYRGIRAGIVNWNAPTTGASSAAPFGGIGCSGNFRPSAYYAADYCSYPVASMESAELQMPEKLTPGVRGANGSRL